MEGGDSTMSGVDSRVVTMKFDNAAFEKGVSGTMSTIAKLKDALNFSSSGPSKSLTDISAAAGKMDLSNVSEQASGISKAFVAMSAVAITAISNLTSKAMEMGGSFVKSISGVAAMTDGFSDYNMKIQATQTIMAGTGASIGKTTHYLKDLDIYADRTIYSLSDMTSNIGKFTNAGVKLPTATKSMIGIANVAALSGANAEEAARAMYNLGQAIGQGTVRMMDWRSVENANMGTQEFKQQLIDSAVAAGTLTKGLDGVTKTSKGTTVTAKNFGSTLQDQWLTSKALVKTLKRYGDENTAIGKKAYIAATQVKTFGMMMDTLKAAAGTGWTDTFDVVIGNLPQATKLWTGLTNSIGKFISNSANARNAMLKEWAAFGGRTSAIESFKNIFKAIGGIIKPIHDAFREIFPPSTGKQLADFTKKVQAFTEKLIPSEKTSDNLRRTFKGLFAVLGIGAEIIKQVVGFFAGMFGLMSGSGGTGAITGMTASLGDFLSKLHDWLVTGGGIASFFDKLAVIRDKVLGPIYVGLSKMLNILTTIFTGAVAAGLNGIKSAFDDISPSINSIGDVATVVFGYLGGLISTAFGQVTGFLSGIASIFDVSAATDKAMQGVDGVTKTLVAAGGVATQTLSAWQKVVNAFKAIGTFLAPVWGFLKSVFSGIKDRLMSFVSGLGIEDSLALVNTGFFMAFYIMLRNFIKSMKGMVKSAQEMFDNVGGVLKQVTANLKTMQSDVRSNIILKIAIALGILAASLWLLSKIDGKALGVAMGAITIMLGELVGALIALEKTSSTKGSINMSLMAAGMVGLGLALLAMAGAIAILGNMDMKTIEKGLGAVAAVLAIVIGASAILSKTGGGAQMIAASIAIGILAIALTAFAGALKLYASLDTSMMAEGGAKVAAAIIAIGIAMRAMPKNMLQSAASLMIVSLSLLAIAAAMKVFAGMSVADMAKSIIMLGASLTIIADALYLMTGTVSGSAALLVAAIALGVLAISMGMLGSLDMMTVVKSLLALVLVLAVFGGAALLLEPVVPVMLALAGALALLGLAALAVGAGLLLFSMGLAALAVSGAAGAAVLVAAVISIAELIPLIMQQFALGLIAFAKVLATAGPPLIKAFTTVLGALITAIIKLLPRVGVLIRQLVTTVLGILVKSVPQIVVAAAQMITGLLTGLASKIPGVVAAASTLIIKFITALGKNGVKIFDAGVTTIIKFINGIADSIRTHTNEMNDAGANLAKAIISGMVKGLAGLAGAAIQAAKDLAAKLPAWMRKILGISSPSKVFQKIGENIGLGLIKGLNGSEADVRSAIEKMTTILHNGVVDTQADIDSARASLKSLETNVNPNKKKIAIAKKALSEAQSLHTKATQANNIYIKSQKAARVELIRLSKDYDTATEALEGANKALDDATKARDDAVKSTTSKYSTLPDIADETTVATYEDSLQKQTDANTLFQTSLEKLRVMGMDDTTYNKLLDEGTAVQPFIDELLAGGPDAVAHLDTLNANLATSAQTLGTQVGADMYQAGVDLNQGIVDGFQKNQDAAVASMTVVATAMANAVRAALDLGPIGVAAAVGAAKGIKKGSKEVKKAGKAVGKAAKDGAKKSLKSHSPSKEMEEIGMYASMGLADGLEKYSHLVSRSASSVSTEALNKIKSTMARVSDSISGEVDPNPVIAPVIDLDQFRKDASKINDLMVANAISASVSYDQAAAISNDRQTSQNASSNASAEAPATVVQFEQNNYSPTALSPVDIYRQTRNQLSLAKEALNA
jgi:tape measure domain-containing protein